jgi:hypothetical protein
MTKARDIASANPAPSTVSATELGYLDGVSSAIQTQLDAKTAKSTLTTTGDIYYASGANTPARLGIGSTGNVLTVAGGIPSWAAPAEGSTFAGALVFSTSASISVANNTVVTLTFNDETIDTNGYHSTTTNTSRLTVPSGKAGYYYIFADLQYAAGTTNKLAAQIHKNGSAIYASAHPAAGGDFNSSCLVYTIANLSVGDYIELKARQITGGSIDAKMNNNNETTLGMYFIGA